MNACFIFVNHTRNAFFISIGMCLCLFFQKTVSLGKNSLKSCATMRNEEPTMRPWEKRQWNRVTHGETMRVERSVISMCTAHLAIHVNMAPLHLISFLCCLITNGPNILTPQYVKGDAAASLWMGRSAIFCSPGLPLSLWRFTHLNKRLLTAALQLVIQYPELLSSFKVAPLPPWAYLMLQCCMIRFDTFYVAKWLDACLVHSEMIFSVICQHILSHYHLRMGLIA